MKSENKIILGAIFTIGLIGYFQRHKIKKLYYMATDTKTNSEHLESLHPKFKPIFKAFISEIEKLGYKPQINSSYRTFKRQAELKAEDKRNAAPGYSTHNYGASIDVQISKNGKVWGKNTAPSEWLKTGIPQIADKLGLFWGANFKNYSDAVHFEIKNLNTAKLYIQALRQFKTNNPDQIEGNKVLIA